MHWTMSSRIVTIVPHLLFSITIFNFSHKIFPDDKACLEEYYVLNIMYLFTLLPTPLHYILLFCDYNIEYFNVGVNFRGQTLGYDYVHVKVHTCKISRLNIHSSLLHHF